MLKPNLNQLFLLLISGMLFMCSCSRKGITYNSNTQGIQTVAVLKNNNTRLSNNQQNAPKSIIPVKISSTNPAIALTTKISSTSNACNHYDINYKHAKSGFLILKKTALVKKVILSPQRASTALRSPRTGRVGKDDRSFGCCLLGIFVLALIGLISLLADPFVLSALLQLILLIFLIIILIAVVSYAIVNIERIHFTRQ